MISLICECCGKTFSNTESFVETRSVTYEVPLSQDSIEIVPVEHGFHKHICDACFYRMFNNYKKSLKEENSNA